MLFRTLVLALMIWLAPPVVNGRPGGAWPPGRELADRGVGNYLIAPFRAGVLMRLGG